MGSNESHFNVSIIVRDKVTRQCIQTTTFLKRQENRDSVYKPQPFWRDRKTETVSTNHNLSEEAGKPRQCLQTTTFLKRQENRDSVYKPQPFWRDRKTETVSTNHNLSEETGKPRQCLQTTTFLKRQENRDSVYKPQPFWRDRKTETVSTNHNLSEETGEPKWNRAEGLLLTSLSNALPLGQTSGSLKSERVFSSSLLYVHGDHKDCSVGTGSANDDVPSLPQPLKFPDWKMLTITPANSINIYIYIYIYLMVLWQIYFQYCWFW